MLCFAVSTMLLGFVGGHSLWRFFLRKQLPSLVHAGTAVLLLFYVGVEFQVNVVTQLPTQMAWVTGIASVAFAALIIRFELAQENPWN